MFSPVLSKAEIGQLLKKACEEQGALYLKPSGEQEVMELLPSQFWEETGGFYVRARLVEGGELLAKAGMQTSGVGSFSLEGHKYFFTTEWTHAHLSKQELRLRVPLTEFYQLQRRSSFRLRLPADRAYAIHLFAGDGRLLKRDVMIYDLSSSGISLVWDKEKSQEMLDHDFLWAEFLFSELVGERFRLEPVRYDERKKALGFQFIWQSSGQESQMMSVVLSLYRRHYHKA